MLRGAGICCISCLCGWHLSCVYVFLRWWECAAKTRKQCSISHGGEAGVLSNSLLVELAISREDHKQFILGVVIVKNHAFSKYIVMSFGNP
jgi:hypothetical protein